MSSAIQLSDEELNKMMMELKDHIVNVKAAATATEKKQLQVVANQHYKKTRSAVNSFGSEVRQLKEPTQKSVFQRKQQAFTEKLKALDKELKDAIHPPKPSKRKDITQEEILMGEGGADGSGFQDAHQVLEAGARIQQDTMESVIRSERLVASAEDTGQETIMTLQKQTETIHQTQQELDTLSGMVDRAKKDVSWFARQMAGDRCFVFFFMLVVMAIAFLIFWKMYARRRDQSRANQETEAPTAGPPVPPPVLSYAEYVAKRWMQKE